MVEPGSVFQVEPCLKAALLRRLRRSEGKLLSTELEQGSRPALVRWIDRGHWSQTEQETNPSSCASGVIFTREYSGGNTQSFSDGDIVYKVPS